MFTVLEDFADAGPLVLAASVSLHVRKHSALVSPEVVLGAEEEDRELSDLVSKVLDVGGDASGVVDLCRPPSEQREKSGGRSYLFNRTTKTPTFDGCVSDPVLSPVCSQFDPDDVPVFGFLSGPAVVAEPAPIRHRDVQAVGVESCWTGFTAQQLPSCSMNN